MAFRVSLFVLALSGVATGVAAKDLSLHQRVTGIGGAPYEETQYFTATKRISDGRASLSIVDAAADTVTMVDKNTKTYVVQTFAQLGQQADMMKKRFESLPPEARKVMGKLLGDEGAIVLRPTGATETIAGYAAREYRIEGGEPMSGSVWVTEALQPPMSAANWEKVGGATGSPQSQGSTLQRLMAQLKGIPLRTTITTTVGARNMTVTTEVVRVSEQSPPPDVMHAPAEYKRIEPSTISPQ